MGMVSFSHGHETILFAVDLCSEMGSRLDLVKHAVATLVQAKKRVCAEHRFGLMTLQQTQAKLLPGSLTSNTDHFIALLDSLQPTVAEDPAAEDPAAAAADTAGAAAADSSSSTVNGGGTFDLGSLISEIQPLLKQQQQPGRQTHIAGGVLTTTGAACSSNRPNSGASTSTSSRGSQMRIILIYGRSQGPVPAVLTQQEQGLALDCLYLHHKHQPGVNQVQQVYSALEDAVDGLSLRVGHSSRIYEASSSRPNKVLSSLAMVLAHPQQRRPQALTQAPLDLSAAPLQALPSDAANLASGVPIMPAASRQQLPPGALSYSSAAAAAAAAAPGTAVDPAAAAAAAAPAWAKPLQASGAWGPAAAGAWGTGAAASGEAAWGSSAGASSSSRQAAAAASAQEHPLAGGGGTGAGMLVLGKLPGAAGAGAGSSPVRAVRSPVTADSPAATAAAVGAVVTGRPVEVVIGAPDSSRPSLDLGEGVVQGFAVHGSSRSSTAGSNGPAAAAAVSPAAVAAAGAVPGGAADDVDVDEVLDVEGIGEDLNADELSDLEAAIKLSLAEGGGDASAGRQQGGLAAPASAWDDQ